MAERFGVVVAVGLTFFGLMLIAAQDIGIQIGAGGGTPDRMVLASTNFGEVGGAKTDIRTTGFGTFSIGEGRGEIRVHRSDKLDLQNSLFSGNSLNFEYNATQPTEGAVSFEVLGKEGNGALYVEVNEKRIFEEKLVTEATETINISGNDLKPGVNTFEIGVTKGGFFSSTHYALEDFEATVTDRKFNDHIDSFQMYQSELRDFVGTNLTFNIPADSSVITEPLRISVNDNNVFESRSVRSDQSISVSRRDAELHPGYNTISFETDADAQYTLENTQMTVSYIGITRSADKELRFDLNSTRRNYVDREDTNEYISFNYQMITEGNMIRMELGDFNTTVSPVNGENRVELPEGILSGSNSLEISSEGSFTLNDFKIISEQVDSQ
jgi:hypothetical protein